MIQRNGPLLATGHAVIAEARRREHRSVNTSLKNKLAHLPEGSVMALQITDTHLYAEPEGRLLGLNTRESLDEVLALAREALPKPDLILATGDLVHDASEAGYARVFARLASFDSPVYCIPGNHDVSATMRRCLDGQQISMPPWVQVGPWLIILLDSVIPGEDGGRLSDESLELVREALVSHPHMYALICLHHHPLPIGSAWMDSMVLENGTELIELAAAHPQAKAILFGHVHQVVDRRYRGIRLLATPSTCIQFAPDLDEFGLDRAAPGMRWLILTPSGEIHTGIERLDAVPTTIELGSTGY